MKKTQIIVFALAFTMVSWAQTPTYKWVSGSQETEVQSELKLTTPGPRDGASVFTDQEGNFWLYGGYGFDKDKEFNNLEDLWKYDLLSKTWTWKGGRTLTSRQAAGDNHALGFDGQDDFIELSENPVDYSTEFTIEFWFRSNDQFGSFVTWTPVEGVDGSYFSVFLFNGIVYLVVDNGSWNLSEANTYADGEWHHVAVVFENGSNNDGQTSLYVDGLFESTRVINYKDRQAPDNQYVTTIGKTESFGLQMSGEIDEVRFWDYPLSTDEIKNSFDLPKLGSEVGLAAYYNFNQGDPDGVNTEYELIDRSPNQVNGELINFEKPPYFLGEIADVRIWGDETPSVPYDETITGSETDLISAYDFTQGDPFSDNSAQTTLIDNSTRGVNGALINFDLDGDQSNYLDGSIPVNPRTLDADIRGRRIQSVFINGDNHLDLIVGNNVTNSFSVFLNDGSGNYTERYDILTDFRPFGIETGYWDDDTNLDVAVTSYTGDSEQELNIYLGDGLGGFTNNLTLPQNEDSSPFGIGSADFNGDLNADIVISLSAKDSIRIYFGDGMGSFGSSVKYPTGVQPRELVIDDFDGNGTQDIAVANQGSDDLSVLLGDGSGGFSGEERYELADRPSDIISQDINNDGIADLLTSNYNASTLSFMIGNGDGTFYKQEDFEVDSGPWGIKTGEFNGDGFLDIATALYNTEKIQILNGDGAGNFHLGPGINIPNGLPFNLTVADFNGDELDDIATSNYTFPSITILDGNEDNFINESYTEVLNFDGVDDYIELFDLRPYDSTYRFEAWVKTQFDGPILSYSDGTYDAGSFSFFIQDGNPALDFPDIATITSNEGVTDGEWHHLAFSITTSGIDDDPELIQIYVDGTQAAQQYHNVDESISASNTGYSTRIGFANNDFELLNDVSQDLASNWTYGVDFPETMKGKAYAAHWTDADGNFMLFGGTSLNGWHNSIHRYDASQDKWITVKGSGNAYEEPFYGELNVSAQENLPIYRWRTQAVVDAQNNVWFFGGRTTDLVNNVEVQLNDLWMYDPLLNEWTRKSGDLTFDGHPEYGTKGVSANTNIPGAREDPITWIDENGLIWVFGGYGFDVNGFPGYLNDLWSFDPTTLQWTWVSGSNEINQAGVYGIKGVYNSENRPGGRTASKHWIDENSVVWVFGGGGFDKFGVAAGYLNDLWSYNPSIEQWAWHSGSDFKGSTGTYNQQGISSSDITPGARWLGDGWIANNELYLFSGSKGNLYNDLWKFTPQNKEWTWISGYAGTTDVSQLGEYGDLDEGAVPHPGARNGGLTWVDSEGSHWLLGGSSGDGSEDGYYNDLWKYEPLKDTWTYLRGSTSLILNEGEYGSKGIGNASNSPKSRWHAAAWTDQEDKLWFFGGINWNTGSDRVAWLNDLWYFNSQSGDYTWVAGSREINAAGVYGTKGESSIGHIPGARSSSSYWSDANGDFWLFGGYENFELKNDLWKFNPSTMEWTWVSGENFENAPGIYGEKGVPNSTNSIGSRRYTDARIDKDGIVWLFGGDGLDSKAQRGFLNDLWKYDPSTNIWTWVSGSNEVYQPVSFGVKGVADPNNIPPPRYGHSTFVDDSGNIWIMGGYGALLIDDVSQFGRLNDLWKYDPKTDLWTWVGGSDQFDSGSDFGTKGEFNFSNEISGRERVLAFDVYDKSIRIFGGRISNEAYENEEDPAFLTLNDFWQIKFIPGLPFVSNPQEIKQSAFSLISDEAWTREYQIQISLSNDFTDSLYNIVSPDPKSSIENLNPGTYYYYRVNATNEIGSSGFTEPDSVLTLPATPTFSSLELAISDLTSSHAFINWEVTEGILDGYYLDISEDPTFENTEMVHEDFDGREIEVSEQQEVMNLKPGTKYYARIQSFNTSGVSPLSQVVSFLTKPKTPTFVPETIVTEITQSSALITWNEVPETLGGYRISVSTIDDGHQDTTAFLVNYSSLNIAKTQTSIRINGLAPGTNYYAYLVAANASGDSELSDKVSIITTPASPVFDLETSIISISQNEITVAWEAPEGFFEGYYLEVSTDPSFVNTNLMLAGYGKGGIPFTLSQDDLSTTVSGLIPGITYHARIRAFNAAGVSPNSNVLNFTPVPKAPTLGQVNNISQTEATINWQSTPGTDVYLMDINTSEGFEEESALFTDFPLAVPFYVLEELSSGIRYYVRVQSSNSSGSSGEMDPADYGQANFITIPGTPDLNNIQYGQNQVTITWPEVTGAASYEVDASDNFFLSFLSDFEAKSTTDSEIVIVGLDPGEEYQVRVRAVNEAGKSPNAQIVDLLTLPGTPTARDASNSSSRVFTANWDAANGADYYVLEVSLDGFQTFHYNEQLSSASPVKIENLIAGETYEYRVKAGNASGESPYSSSIEVIAQNTAQSLSIASLEYEDAFGENTTSAVISVQFSGGVGDPEVIIRHKEVLSPTWSDDIDMVEVSPTEFEFTVLDNMLDEVGMVFEIEADDGVTLILQKNNTIKRTFTESSSEPLPKIALGQWSMISIPYLLEDNLVVSIFNELSDLPYRKRWRLMTYQEEEYQDQGVGFTRIDLGRGYWFNSLNDVTISVGAGQTNSTIPFEMALDQGWNQIGNPYNTSINWDEILDENALTINVGRIITYDPETREFNESRTLDPFSGAFVFADQAITLAVSPIAGLTNARTEQISESEEFSGENWIKKLNLHWGGKSREIAAIGMHNLASSSKDQFDKPVIPRFENYLEMYSKVEDYFYPKFSHDIKPKSEEHVWSYDLESNHISGLAALTWNPDMVSPGKLWLVDETNGKITEMSNMNTYSFAMNRSHQFSIHYSEDPNYVVIPTRLALGDIYPNPVSSTSQIPLLLPKKNETYDLQLNLFNMNGQLVKTIATGNYAPGIHIFEVDVEDIGLRDGMYFYGVTFKNMDYTPRQKKIIIKR